MKGKVAVATVQGKAYYLLVNALHEQGISFYSLIPGQPVPTRAKLVITTEQEKEKVTYPKVLVFSGEESTLDVLVMEVKKHLLGKETYEHIVVGIDPGEVNGLAVLADGKMIEEANCTSSRELINVILKVLRSVNFSVTEVTVKIGNGTPIYRELLADLDEALPIEVNLEVVVDHIENYLTGVNLIIIDTITSLYSARAAETPKSFSANRELNRQLALLAEQVKVKKIPLIFTSQVRSIISDQTSGVRPVATRVIQFWADNIIFFKPTELPQTIRVNIEKPASTADATQALCYIHIGENGLRDTQLL